MASYVIIYLSGFTARVRQKRKDEGGPWSRAVTRIHLPFAPYLGDGSYATKLIPSTATSFPKTPGLRTPKSPASAGAGGATMAMMTMRSDLANHPDGFLR